MVRAHASQQNKKLAALVANVVTTTPSRLRSATRDTVSRSGANSVFDFFSKVFPNATRDNTRSGITEAEFNKVLEKDGFLRVRMRATVRQVAGNMSQSASFYRFGRRRWRNPDDADDMAAIANMWQSLAEVVDCAPLEEMLSVLRKAIADDALSLAKSTKRMAHLESPSHPFLSPTNHSDGSPQARMLRKPTLMISESPCSQADTDEGSSRSPFFPASVADDDINCIYDDDEELQEKLAKEEFSAVGLPAFQPFDQANDVFEASSVSSSDVDSAYDGRSALFEPSELTVKDIEVLAQEDYWPIGRSAEGLMAILGGSSEPKCCV